MNIFYVDADPAIAARSLVNKHVVKMIVESCQLLSTAHRVLDGQLVTQLTAKGRKKKHWQLSGYRDNVLYKVTHVNHPSAIWVRTSVANYRWLLNHLYALLEEYTYRYGKIHKCQIKQLRELALPPVNLTNIVPTEIPCVMPIEYIVAGDPVASYRNYYQHGKTHLHVWKNRDKPDWII